MTETEFIDLVSGRRRGFVPEVQRFGLLLASGGYGLGAALRNAAFDVGLLPIRRAGLPVISVGNLTTGGTGKTPFAAWLARWFRGRGVRPCFVSRGYGANPGGQNDEAMVLELHCPDVPHLQDGDRFRAAEVARIELESQLILLDDGFQHRQLARDLDIVLIDAMNPFGHGHWLPRGLLREPRYGLARAEVIVVTRVDQAGRDSVQKLTQRLRGFQPEGLIAQAQFPPQGLVSAGGTRDDLGALQGQTIAAFCGIGNPGAFETSLRHAGARVVAFKRFADHQPYGKAEVEWLTQWVRETAPRLVLTTQKDLVKLQVDRLAGVPLWALEIGTVIVAGNEELQSRLERILERIPRE